MLFGYFTLFVALLIEVVGAYYSITGLATIFSGAVIPILIMGGVLELGKVTAAVWLKNNWHRASAQFKAYLLPAVIMLMFITSMGIFGFLSKAHNDQNLVSGDVTSKIAIYDEKIKIQKDNIDSARRALQQMDAAVDQTMARSTNEQGADKATAIRRGQARERTNLQNEIAKAQAEIVKLNDLRAPIAAEVRKVEAEVGPIKYIAKLIYGDNPDANLLEKAVTWVIVMIVAVFDPLALVLILAAQQSIRWAREEQHVSTVEDKNESLYTSPVDNLEPVVDQIDVPEDYFQPTEVVKPQHVDPVLEEEYPYDQEPIEQLFIDDHIDDDDHDIDELEKQARRNWKESHPGETIKKYQALYNMGHIDDLPWNHPDYRPVYQDPFGLEVDNTLGHITGEVKGFGTSFPTNPNKGDMFLRVDQLPSVLFKFNGSTWIQVDKSMTDQHAYNEAYIDHLIEKISNGEYDPELLSDAERDSIENRLNNKQA